MTSSVEGVSWETIVKLVLAAGVLAIFVLIGVALMNQARPDTDYASTTSFQRVFLGNVNEVYNTNISRSTYLNLGSQREMIYADSNTIQQPKCNVGDRCVCLYNINSDNSQGSLIECDKIKPKLTMEYKGDYNQYKNTACFASNMVVCDARAFPTPSTRTLYFVSIIKTSDGVDMKFD